MQIKYKLRIFYLSILAIITLVILFDILFVKKPLRQQEALEEKKRIIIPFQEIKDKYNRNE